DPSAPMLEVARELDALEHSNVHWIHGPAESARLHPPYDLVTAGASIHWMDHAAVFPRLAGAIADDGRMAVIEGDGAYRPPWEDTWLAFIKRWLERVGRPYDERRRQELESYRNWMDVEGEQGFAFAFTQVVEDFIECQHSRATWARAKMGRDLAEEFDAELREIVAPFSENGSLRYTVRSELVWGRPRDSSISAS
ncbi:MAG: class I SAM-dependent methyltransferase, partial [Gammaproteobacteria bacterium]